MMRAPTREEQRAALEFILREHQRMQAHFRALLDIAAGVSEVALSHDLDAHREAARVLLADDLMLALTALHARCTALAALLNSSPRSGVECDPAPGAARPGAAPLSLAA